MNVKSLSTDSIAFMDYFPSAESLEKTKMGMQELMGKLYYWLKLLIS